MAALRSVQSPPMDPGDKGCRRLRSLGAIPAIPILLAMTGCGATTWWTAPVPSVDASQFNAGETSPERASRMVVPAEIFGPPAPLVDTTVESGPDTTFVERDRSIQTTMPDGKRVALPLGPEELARELPPGRPWPVDGLVGQINGKAIYADDFLEPMSARLAQLGASADRGAARRQIIQMVGERFEEEVNNRLIISEAESSIPPEAREGLFQWLRTLQEQEVAARGGTKSGASASLQDQFGMTVEQFLERRRNEALAGDLIRRRLAPRAIVSWRDIERAYEKAYSEYNPGPTIVVGRLILRTQEDAARIEEIKSQFAAGADFGEVARALRMPNDGVWFERQLDDKGIDGLTDLRPELRSVLASLPVGKASDPVPLGTATMFVIILRREQPPARSLFDPTVQIRLRNELERYRLNQEQVRYFEALRSRWISDDIDEMRLRLIDIALRRYFQP